MAKETTGLIKLQVPGGKATPAPPVGPALGQHGVNIGEFVQRFNAETASQQGLVIPVVITVYSDRTFDLAFKSPPAAVLIKKAVGLEKAANDPIERHEIAEAARIEGMESLREAAIRRLADGVTPFEEVIRITGDATS